MSCLKTWSIKGSDANIVAMSASISAVSTVAYWCSATELFAQLAERVMQPEVGLVGNESTEEIHQSVVLILGSIQLVMKRAPLWFGIQLDFGVKPFATSTSRYPLNWNLPFL